MFAGVVLRFYFFEFGLQVFANVSLRNDGKIIAQYILISSYCSVLSGGSKFAIETHGGIWLYAEGVLDVRNPTQCQYSCKNMP